MKNIKKCASDIVSQWTEQVMYGWPPDCFGGIYQPERPAMINEAGVVEVNEDDQTKKNK